MSDFRVDVTQLEAAAKALRTGGDEAIGDVAQRAVGELASTVHDSVRQAASRHRRTGGLERRIQLVDDHAAGIDSTATVRVIGRVAPIITGGSRPHAIAPRRARALAFAGPARGFAERVRHPGTSPDPFFARGVRDATADVDRITERAAEQSVAQLAKLAEG